MSTSTIPQPTSPSAPPVKTDSFATKALRVLASGPLNIVLIVVALLWLLPTFGLLIGSLRNSGDNADSGWWQAITNPSQLSLDNYSALFESDKMVQAFWNTVFIAVPSTLLVVLLAALAAYAFAFISFPGRDWLLLLVVGLLVVPIQVALIPLATLFGDIGIFGSRLAVVLFHVGFGLPFAVFLLRNFFIGIPREMLEAARIDGASEMRIFARVVLPVALPAIASLSIFQFLWTWNDMLVALIFAGPDNGPLTVAIREQTRQFGANIDIIAPGAFISMIVPLIVFFAFQRYFVQGMLAGSEK